jgi:hypothetical protein
MPLGQREGVATCSRFCGVETHFNNSMKHILDTNVHIGGGFDYVVVPLVRFLFFILSHFFSTSFRFAMIINEVSCEVDNHLW